MNMNCLLRETKTWSIIVGVWGWKREEKKSDPSKRAPQTTCTCNNNSFQFNYESTQRLKTYYHNVQTFRKSKLSFEMVHFFLLSLYYVSSYTMPLLHKVQFQRNVEKAAACNWKKHATVLHNSVNFLSMANKHRPRFDEFSNKSAFNYRIRIKPFQFIDCISYM